jgi:hypothetical protein
MRWLARSRARSTATLIVLLFADAWLALTIITATTGGEGEGSVFWWAVAILALLLAALLHVTIRVARLVRRSDRS